MFKIGDKVRYNRNNKEYVVKRSNNTVTTVYDPTVRVWVKRQQKYDFEVSIIRNENLEKIEDQKIVMQELSDSIKDLDLYIGKEA